MNEADSQVSRAVASLASFKGSKINESFIEHQLHSWQAHLERISPFLLEGGVWWREFNGIYYFMDGDDDRNYHSQDLTLLHFKTSSLDDVVIRQKKSWKQILDQFIPLPTPKVHIYYTDGKPTGTRIFSTISSQISSPPLSHSSGSMSSGSSPVSHSSGSMSSGSTPLSHSSGTVGNG